MDKRETIEKALGQFCSVVPGIEVMFPNIDLDAVGEQAIVIECEVEHSKFHTIVKNEIGNLPNRLVISEHHGTPGKAVAIILPLDNHNG